MARRTITVPNYTLPGAETTTNVTIKIDLVDEDDNILDGYTDTEGVVGSLVLYASDTEQTFDLSPQADINGGAESRWRVRIYQGTKLVRDEHIYFLEEDSSDLDLDDFLAKGNGYFDLPFTLNLPDVRSGDSITTITATLTDEDGTAVDLTGATAELLWYDEDNTLVDTWSTDTGELVDPVSDPTQGKIRINPEVVSLDADTYYQVFRITYASGVITSYWRGTIVVTP